MSWRGEVKEEEVKIKREKKNHSLDEPGHTRVRNIRSAGALMDHLA